MRVGILIYEGFDELDAIGPYEVFQNAAEKGAAVEARLVTLAPAVSVRAGHGLAVASQGTLDEEFDWILVVGGRWAARGPVGAWAEIQKNAIPSALRRMRDRGQAMAAVCTGTMILSAAGVTRGRRVTTHAAAFDALRSEGGDLVRARVVDDGDLVTAGGVTSGIDLALWLVERWFGRELSDSVAVTMEYPRASSVSYEGMNR